MSNDYGLRLQAARKAAGYRTQQALGDRVGRSGKTVRNWETGVAMPDEAMKAELRVALGPFDDEGDPVEVALRRSALHEWRQDAVVSTYKRHLHEQRGEVAG